MLGLGKRVREVRKLHGLTQIEFGQRIGCTGPNVAGIENGRSDGSIALIKNIAWEFNVNEEWLLTGKGERNRGAMRNFNPETEETILKIITIFDSEDDEVKSHLQRQIELLYERLKR